MNTIPTLSEEVIRSRVGERSFERGYQYFLNGAIFDRRRQGMTLKARCEGRRAEAYRVQVTFNVAAIASANCSCPVGAGGYCKHVAALLLTWLDRPEEFVEVEDVDTALERRSKEELIALVKQMLRQQPDLETLLEVPLTVDGKRRMPVNPETYRRQAETAFRYNGRDWRAASTIAQELSAITRIGDDFLKQEDYSSAAVVYQTVSDVVVDRYESIPHDEGELGMVVDDCMEGLGRCLNGITDDEARERILRTLFAVYRFDVANGYFDLRERVPDVIREHGTVEERGKVAAWVREALPDGTNRSDDYRRRAYGAFLLKLEADTLDDEAYLRICRETGRLGELIDRLLALGRVEEAAREAGQVVDYELLKLIDVFLQRGREDVAERVVAEQATKTKNTRVLRWLKDHYREQGKLAAALALTKRIFRLSPSLQSYQELRELAIPLDHWETMHLEHLEFLRRSNLSQVLVEVYLDEGEIDEALEMVKPRPSSSYRSPRSLYSRSLSTASDDTLALKVAQAAEDARPQAALEIYRSQAERIIETRDRGTYQHACELLMRVRTLYERLGERTAWDRYIGDLRKRTRRLRALQVELDEVGL